MSQGTPLASSKIQMYLQASVRSVQLSKNGGKDQPTFKQN